MPRRHTAKLAPAVCDRVSGSAPDRPIRYLIPKLVDQLRPAVPYQPRILDCALAIGNVAMPAPHKIVEAVSAIDTSFLLCMLIEVN